MGVREDFKDIIFKKLYDIVHKWVNSLRNLPFKIEIDFFKKKKQNNMHLKWCFNYDSVVVYISTFVITCEAVSLKLHYRRQTYQFPFFTLIVHISFFVLTTCSATNIFSRREVKRCLLYSSMRERGKFM